MLTIKIVSGLNFAVKKIPSISICRGFNHNMLNRNENRKMVIPQIPIYFRFYRPKARRNSLSSKTKDFRWSQNLKSILEKFSSPADSWCYERAIRHRHPPSSTREIRPTVKLPLICQHALLWPKSKYRLRLPVCGGLTETKTSSPRELLGWD